MKKINTCCCFFVQWHKLLLMMKFIWIFIMAGLLTASATTYSQTAKFDLKMKNATLKSVLNEIEEKTEFYFFYNNDEIENYEDISVEATQASIEDVLKEVLKNKGFKYEVHDRYILLKKNSKVQNLKSNNQQSPVSGRVVDRNGEVLPGVTVLVKGTTQGTITDFEGNFTIPGISSGDVLVFSFIGMRTAEITFSGQSNINVILEEDNIGIEEVVAIGYGTQKKASLTGSIATVKGDVLEKSPSPNLTNAIAGQLSGVIANIRSGEPGNDDAEIFIRGKGTLGDNDDDERTKNAALIVIDGIPDRGGFGRLNPEDIESLTVLKDASAAIYGARAANGVILITTKRGVAGEPTLNINSSIGWSQPTRIPEFLDSYRYAIAENEYRANFTGEQPRWLDEDIEKFRTGSSPLTHPSTDWLNTIFKDWTKQHNHSVSLRGGSEKVKYFVSGQYLYQDGNFHEGTDYNQFQYRSNLDVQVTDELTMSVDLSYRLEDKDLIAPTGNNTIWWSLKSTYPFLIPYYPNGLPGLGSGIGGNMAIRSSKQYGYKREKNHVYNTKLNFKYDLSKITEGLYILGYGVLDRDFVNDKIFKRTWSEYGYLPETDEYVEYPAPHPRTLEVRKRNETSTTLHARLAYDRVIGDHEFSGFIAYEQNKISGDEVSAFRERFISDKVDQLFAGADNENKTNYGFAWETGRVNYFGRIHYGYKEKYLIDFTLRHDGSQNFAKEKRFGTFPGTSVAWRMSEEPFFNVDFVDYLKVRGSWGQMGNDRVDPYQYLTTYRLGIPDQFVNEVYFFGTEGNIVKNLIADQTPNPDITWETATTINFGFDASLFNEKLSVTSEVFSSKRRDILIARSASVPAYTGLDLPKENLGKVNSKGLELELAYQGKIGEDFSFFAKGNLTYATNKVVFLDEAAGTPEEQKREGYPMDAWFVYQSDGLFQTQEEVDNYPNLNAKTGPGDVKILDINGDSIVNALDRKRLTTGETPEIMYGITFGGSHKGFDLSVFFQGQARALRSVAPGTLNVSPEFFDERWQKEGDNKYPRVFYGPTTIDGQSNSGGDFWLRSAAFIRLKNVELAYTLPKNVSTKVGFSRMRVFVSGSNLFTIDKIKLFDPELTSGDGISYPLQRMIRMGVNLSL